MKVNENYIFSYCKHFLKKKISIKHISLFISKKCVNDAFVDIFLLFLWDIKHAQSLHGQYSIMAKEILPTMYPHR